MNPIKHITICGHNIELHLTQIQPQKASYYINDELLNYKMMDNIVKQIKAGNRQGVFKARAYISTCNQDGKQLLKIAGTWSIRIDYGMLYRIFRWWYNCNFKKETVNGLFSQVFGFDRSSYYCQQYYDKYQGSLFDFIGFIGNDTQDGYAFFDLVWQQTLAYEQKFKLKADL